MSKVETTETDEEIECRLRDEIPDLGAQCWKTRLRIPGTYEIVALLRLLDKERAREELRRRLDEQHGYR